jgi:hypothetical protein
MEPMDDRFYMMSDKELAMQAMNRNHIPSLELVDPKLFPYPIVGRKYGHHKGTDITIVNTPDQALEGGYDFFTKLCVIEKEYLFHINALTVYRIQEAEAKQAVFNEIPIRTEPFGWSWIELKPGEIAQLPGDWLHTAIRALYVTGLSSGVVKIGKLDDDSAIVLDIHPSPEAKATPQTPQDWSETKLSFTLGADIEFMLRCDGDLIPASAFFPLEGSVGCDERQIEQDSGEYALAEIRPQQAETPHELIDNIRNLLTEASKMAPYANVEFLAGSMPFPGYQCGGHIHFGLPLSLSLLQALDHYLAIPAAMIEEPRTGKRRRRTKHGGLGRYREKPYGFEYLSLSSWIIEPELALALLCLAHLVAAHHHELPSDFAFDPSIQRAYYQGNQMILKKQWNTIKHRIMTTSTYNKYRKELSVLFERIEQGNPCKETDDIRKNWGLVLAEQAYERGRIIQIPKNTRLKFNLTEGQNVQVRAGKFVSPAVIHAYPFTFRYSNRVQLSPSLRQALSMPPQWNPKICSASGALVLGPIIGILARRPYDRQVTYFQHLFRIAHEKQMLVYVFDTQDVDWEAKVIYGTSEDGEGWFPFPAVVYDRYFVFGEQGEQILNEFRNKLHFQYDIPFVNPPSLFQVTSDKWATFELLSKANKRFLPDSRLVERAEDIASMLNSYGEVFLKPLNGSLSRGVIQVIRRPAGIYWVHLRQRSVQLLANLEEMYAHFEPLLLSEPYLMQEGIRRKQFKGRNVEIRIYMQKNGLQNWMRTGVVARLTHEGVLTQETEVNRRISHVLNSLYLDPTERRNIRKQLATVSRSAVEAIEEQVGPFGELAVDVCIDTYNCVKLIEINAKPDNLFSQINAYKLRSIAGIRLLNYAASLAGYETEES